MINDKCSEELPFISADDDKLCISSCGKSGEDDYIWRY